MSQPPVVDFGAIGICLAVVFPALASIYRSRCARDNVNKRFSQPTMEKFSAIEGDRIIPALVALIESVTDDANSRGQSVSATLLDHGYEDALSALSQMYSQLTGLQELPRSLSWFIGKQTWPLLLLILAWAGFLSPLGLRRVVVPVWVPVSSLGLLVVSIVLLVILLAFEWRTRDRLITFLENGHEG